jgi:hypothetical protein
MVRRRCRRIVVVDAGCDPEYKYEDVENALRKIRIDFGIQIDFGVRPLPRPRVDERDWKHRIAIGTIRYSAEGGEREFKDGDIILIKPILLGNESVDVLRYAASRPPGGKPFPQESTADQFFSEAQFESYRALGDQTVSEDLDWTVPVSGGPRPRSRSRPNPLPPLPPSNARPEIPGDTDGGSRVGETVGALAGAARSAALVAGLGAGAGAVGLGVAHFTGDVHLDERDRVVLSRPLHVDVPPVRLDGEARALLDGGLQLKNDELVQSINELAQAISRAGGASGQGLAQVMLNVDDVKRALSDVQLHVTLAHDTGDGSLSVRLGELRQTLDHVDSALRELRTKGEGANTPPAAWPPGYLREVEAQLKRIADYLQRGTPMNPIRSVPGGATQ